MPEQTGNGTGAIWGIEQPKALSPNLLKSMTYLLQRAPGALHGMAMRASSR